MTRGFDYPLEISLGVSEPARAMSFKKWIRLTTHWVVGDCDLGNVSVYTSSRDV